MFAENNHIDLAAILKMTAILILEAILDHYSQIYFANMLISTF